MKSILNGKSVEDKVLFIIRVVLSAVVIIFALLQLLGVWDKALNVAIPLLSVLILIQSIQEHRGNKKTAAIIGYVCFVIMIVMSIGALFIK